MSETTPHISFKIFRPGAENREVSFDRPIINVGKLSTSNLRLDDINVSRKHAVIEQRENGEWRITDLGSTNGTFVNGERVVQSALVSGDRLGLGESELEVVLDGAAAESAVGDSPAGEAAVGAAAKAKVPAGQEIRGLGQDSFYDKRSERGDSKREHVLEVALLWGETVLSIEHFSEPQSIPIGEDSSCRFTVPQQVLGRSSFNLVESKGGVFALNLTNPTLVGDVLTGDGVMSLDDLKASPSAKGGFYPIDNKTRARLRAGEFTLLVSYGPMPARHKASPLSAIDLTPLIFITLSLILHSLFLITVRTWPEDQLTASLDPDARRERLVKMMRVTPEEEELKKEEEKKEEEEKEKKELEDSDQLALEEVTQVDTEELEDQKESLLDKLAKPTDRREELANLSPEDRKKKAKEIAASTGALAAMNAGGLMKSLLDPETKSDLLTGKQLTAMGEGGEADPFAGGVGDGVFGAGDGGAGGGFLGSGSVGGTGGGPGGGAVGGLGGKRGGRSIGLSNRPLKPVAVAARANVSGQLDRATVQKIIRRNLSGIRWCYQDALQRNKALRGKIRLGFTILPSGKVAKPRATNSSISDSALMSCITRKMARWRFPSPKNGGVVKVNYPLILKTR